MKRALSIGSAGLLVLGMVGSSHAQVGVQVQTSPRQGATSAPATHSAAIRTAQALDSCISGSQLFMAAKMCDSSNQQGQNQTTSYTSSIQQLQQQAQKEFQTWEQVAATQRGEGAGRSDQWSQDFYRACDQYRQTLTTIVGSNSQQPGAAGEQPEVVPNRTTATNRFSLADYASITLINHSLGQSLRAYEFQQVPSYQAFGTQLKTESQQSLQAFMTQNKIQSQNAQQGDQNQTVTTPPGQQSSSAQVQRLAQQAQQIMTLISQSATEIRVDEAPRSRR